MSKPPLSPIGPGGLLHNYGINYNMLETILPNYGIIRRVLSRKAGVDISSVLGVAFIGLTLAKTCTSVWDHLKKLVLGSTSWFTSSITLHEDDILARNVAAWMAENLTSSSTRFLSATSSDDEGRQNMKRMLDAEDMIGNFNDPRDFPDEPRVGAGSDDLAPRVMYYPAIEGRLWFWFQGTLIIVRRETGPPESKDELNLRRNRDQDYRRSSQIILTCLGWSPSPIKNFLQSCVDFAVESEYSTTTIHRETLGYWDRGITRPSRPLSTVDLDPVVKTELINDIESYLGARQFYARRGIPYRRGYLFHGPPGTGKTSLAGAIAGHFNLDLYLGSLTKLDDAQVDRLFRQLPPRCVVMLEDVDAANVTQERETKPTDSKKKKEKLFKPLTLSGLLNAIDGASSKEGRILIMTSNLPEVLDKALIRPGRIDRQVYLGPVSKQNAKQIFLRMYTQDPDEVKKSAVPAQKKRINSDPNLITMLPAVSPISRGSPQSPRTPLSPFVMRSPRPFSSDGWHENIMDDLEKMAVAFMNKIPDRVLTPAEVQGFLLSHRDDMLGALTQCDSWVAEMLDAKQRKSNIVKLDPAPNTHLAEGEEPVGNIKPRPAEIIRDAKLNPAPTAHLTEGEQPPGVQRRPSKRVGEKPNSALTKQPTEEEKPQGSTKPGPSKKGGDSKVDPALNKPLFDEDELRAQMKLTRALMERDLKEAGDDDDEYEDYEDEGEDGGDGEE
ncbi:hypothetical protein G7Y79_00005g017630 [Physcia stellaris]|nr:hypothetical protein G7Y79_00005g017630 [Physcia stellaris]